MSDARHMTEHDGQRPDVSPMDPTGVPNLDRILGGGLARGALVIVVGAPGSGKTILASQIAFNSARQGRRAMVLTALSESTTKLIAHLRSFQFFDEEVLADKVHFLSLQQFLKQGLDKAADDVLEMARQYRVGMVVLDGFRGMRGAATHPQEAREFLYDLGTSLSLIGATSIVTSEADPRDPAFFPESTTADAILGLHYEISGVRQVRKIEAIKVRGAAPMPGLHGMAIGDEGVVAYPRLEARVAAESRQLTTARMLSTRAPETVGPQSGADALARANSAQEDRATFALPELDELLGGGLNRGTSTIIFGSPGAGKTTLALRFALAGVEAGEQVLFLGFHETPEQLVMKADILGMGSVLREALTSERLTLVRMAPIELNPDVVAHQILALQDETRAVRLVVDSIVELREAASAPDEGRTGQYMTAFMEAIRRRNVTAVFTTEVRSALVADLDFTNEPTSPMAENVLLLQQVVYQGQLHRVLSVLKMRFSDHDSTLREYRIVPGEGVRVLAPLESGEEILAGIAQMQGTSQPFDGEHDSTVRREARGTNRPIRGKGRSYAPNPRRTTAAGESSERDLLP